MILIHVQVARKMYSRCVDIIDTIKKISEENGGDTLSAVARRQSQKWSLNKLNAELRKEQ